MNLLTLEIELDLTESLLRLNVNTIELLLKPKIYCDPPWYTGYPPREKPLGQQIMELTHSMVSSDENKILTLSATDHEQSDEMFILD